LGLHAANQIPKMQVSSGAVHSCRGTTHSPTLAMQGMFHTAYVAFVFFLITILLTLVLTTL